MDYSNKDLVYMQLAVEMAAKGVYATAPNPNVGCVIVKNNEIIAKSYHYAYGLAHAETNALNIAGSDAQDATMYVNLEPCSHHGKTPPCVDMIISHKIKHVIIAISDPFHMVNGDGIKKLKQAGITVDTGCLSDKAIEVNLGFLSRIKRYRPWMTMCIDNEHNLLSANITQTKLSKGRSELRFKSDLIITDDITDPIMYKMDGKIIKKLVMLHSQIDNSSNKNLFNSASNLVLSNLYLNAKLDANQLLKQLLLLKHNYALIEATHEINLALLDNNLIDEIVVFLKPNSDISASNQVQLLINKYHFKILDQQIIDNYIQVKLRKEFDINTLLI
jgi:riboflavin biosynthesis protein RibD